MTSSCCDAPRPPQEPMDWGDMPDETFCCMAEIGYEVATKTLHGDRRKHSWWTISSSHRREYAQLTKAWLMDKAGPTGRIQEIMYIVVVTMTRR